MYVFDIDDTLFKTSARVKIVNTDSGIEHYKTSEQLKNYSLTCDESASFSEFKDAEIFCKESSPIKPMIKVAQACIDKTSQGSRTIFVTARSNLNNKNRFISYLNSCGLDMRLVRVERAGNYSKLKTSEAKKFIIKRYIESEAYDNVYFFDDSLDNILSFIELREHFPSINLLPKLVLN